MSKAELVYFKNEQEVKQKYIEWGLISHSSKRPPKLFFFKINNDWHTCSVIGYGETNGEEILVIQLMNLEKKTIHKHQFLQMQKEKTLVFATNEQKEKRKLKEDARKKAKLADEMKKIKAEEEKKVSLEVKTINKQEAQKGVKKEIKRKNEKPKAKEVEKKKEKSESPSEVYSKPKRKKRYTKLSNKTKSTFLVPKETYEMYFNTVNDSAILEKYILNDYYFPNKSIAQLKTHCLKPSENMDTYFNDATYEKLKRFAIHKGVTISDIFCDALENMLATKSKSKSSINLAAYSSLSYPSVLVDKGIEFPVGIKRKKPCYPTLVINGSLAEKKFVFKDDGYWNNAKKSGYNIESFFRYTNGKESAEKMIYDMIDEWKKANPEYFLTPDFKVKKR
ncbi:hypothetical protein [Bacillus sp. SM2101]|uniref:hypothetical protein n=1 Tax=Bacillus sp. SM2101 TaxID=2805366 RepID=UPI001BDE78E4|nr:hypothetical protein [Bacillus sp. SM2101]